MREALGDYAIIEQWDVETCGTVYLAEHRFLKRLFFLKVLPEELARDQEFLRRFEEEIIQVAQLDHPHILKTHNATFADGCYFVATDSTKEGGKQLLDLASYLELQEKGLDEEKIERIASQLASALDYAHKRFGDRQPCVHGGLKLNKVLLDPTSLDVYLTDFGLSRIVGAGALLSRMYYGMCDELGAKAGIYRSVDREPVYSGGVVDSQNLRRLHGSFLRDFAFLAPEQRVSSASIASTKSDTYAFGVLLYYLLMGKVPEGMFELPSYRYPKMHYNWDLLLYHCLQADQVKRPDSLVQAIDDLLRPKTILPALLTEIERSHATSKEGESSSLKPVIRPAELTRPEFIPDPAVLFVVDPTVARYQPKDQEGDLASTEPLLSDMVIIHGNSYMRGSLQGGRDEMPRHMINIDSFAIDIHPVTNEQFVRFLEVMGGEKDMNNNDMIRLRDSRIKRSGGKLSIESGYTKHPVVGVSWYGAVAYAKWVGKRLPTEAEWEIAATCGLEENVYPTGVDIERSQANFFSSDTTMVMSYPPNPHGLYDVAGNVYEWCHDWYGYHYYDVSVQEPNNPKGPVQGTYRILRGGCWKSLKEDLRCSHRHRNNPGTMNGTYGFRCAADVSQ